MAFVTGTAANITELTNAVISACTSNGWTASAADVVSKGDCFIRLTPDTTNDRVTARAGLGYSGGALTDPCAKDVYFDHPLTSEAWSYPLSYNIHLHGNEVYAVANWGTDKYSFLAFGQSKVTGMTGKGVWICGTGLVATDAGGVFYWENDVNSYAGFQGYSNNSQRYAVTGIFAMSRTGGIISTSTPGTYVHHGLTGWSGDTIPTCTGGCRNLTYYDNPAANPTGQTVLVPIQPMIDRGSNKMFIVLDLLHARFVRLDTLNAGDIITFGSDKWKVYPIYKRNSATRSPATSVNHTGTYGYAIKYDGP